MERPTYNHCVVSLFISVCEAGTITKVPMFTKPGQGLQILVSYLALSFEPEIRRFLQILFFSNRKISILDVMSW